jgi:hypothetical protein
LVSDSKGKTETAYKNWVLRRKFGLKTNKITGGCRNCTMRSFVNSYTSPNITRMTDSRVRWESQKERTTRKMKVGGY